jgi:hypothetical protein
MKGGLALNTLQYLARSPYTRYLQRRCCCAGALTRIRSLLDV